MNAFVLNAPARVLFSIGGFEIYCYGVIMAIAIISGVFVSNFLVNKSQKLPQDIFITLSPLTIILGLIGARLWYCAVNFSTYVRFPFEILDFRGGGISIHGAILGGFIALFYYAKKNKLNLVTLCDYSVPGLALGQAIGRWGNFFNNEAFGLSYDGWLKLYIPPVNRPEQFINNEYFHPTFLYESVLNLVLFVVLFRLSGKFLDGKLTLIYLCGYSLIRFLVELLRIDSTLYVGGLPFPAFVSLIIYTVSTFVLIKLYK